MLLAVLGQLASSTVAAVSLSENRRGQVLIYPYYTVRADQATLFSVVNTTSQSKALSFQVLEGKGGAVVLELHLYLWPEDVWTGAIVSVDGRARLFTSDISCTLPEVPERGLSLKRSNYLDDAYGDNRPDRLNEGFVQIIEMGEIIGPMAEQMINNWPDCSIQAEVWEPGGVWDLDPLTDIGPPGGGLIGSETLIDVVSGRAISIDATALEGFWNSAKHVPPQSGQITLADVEPPVSVRLTDEGMVTDTWSAHPIQAVSAVLSAPEWMGEYVVDAFTRSETDWILSAPTRAHHLQDQAPVPPYNQLPLPGEGTCERHSHYFLNREVNFPLFGCDVPLLPPDRNVIQLCWSSSMVGIDAESESGVFHSQNLVPVSAQGFQNGWLSLRADAGSAQMVSDEGRMVSGLPLIGQRITSYDNGVVDDSLRSFAVRSRLYQGDRFGYFCDD